MSQCSYANNRTHHDENRTKFKRPNPKTGPKAKHVHASFM